MGLFEQAVAASAFARIAFKLRSATDWDRFHVLSPLLAQAMHRYHEFVMVLVKAMETEDPGTRLYD